MARETRIGIALMVLLVGVFGAIVYKKWNGRQPTVLAAASEESLGNPSKTAEDSGDAETEESVEEATSIEEEHPFTADVTGEFHSIEETSPSPMAQAEPMPEPSPAPAQEDPFSFDEVAESNVIPQVPEPEPVVEPAPDAAFADAATAEFSPETQFKSEASPDESSQATIASTPPTPIQSTVDDDPFADPFEDAAAKTEVTEKAAVTTVDDDDPFSAPVTDDPSPSDFAPAEKTSNTKIASGAEGESGSFVSETQTVRSETAGATQSFSAEGMSDSSLAEDPFSDVPSQTMETAEPATLASSPQEFASTDSSPSVPNDNVFGDSGAPAEFVPEDSAASVDGFDGGFEKGFEAASNAELTSQSVVSPRSEEPIASSSRPSRSDYHIVAANESYWTISKKIYGTPAYYHALAQFNIERIKDPNRLKAGWKILTPPAEELSAKFPKLVSSVPQGDSSEASHVERPGFMLDSQGRPCYRVGDSDTLGAIAQVHLGRASRWVQIYELNRTSITDPKSLKPGTVLLLPPDASRVRLVPEG